jgi:hypothetical protein
MVSGYNFDESLKAVYYSAAAYCSKDSVVNWNCGQPCSLYSSVQNITRIENFDTDLFGYIAFNPLDN